MILGFSKVYNLNRTVEPRLRYIFKTIIHFLVDYKAIVPILMHTWGGIRDQGTDLLQYII